MKHLNLKSTAFVGLLALSLALCLPAQTTIKHVLHGDSTSDLFGQDVHNAGDVDNDGFDDVIIGAQLDDNNGSNSGSCRVISGATGATLYTIYGDNADDRRGVSNGVIGDINNDGHSDFISGAFRDDNNGSNSGNARVYSGIDGSIIYSWDGAGVNFFFGAAVSGAGDVNADGTPDILVSAYQANPGGLLVAGEVYVYSGIDGSLLYTFSGNIHAGQLGRSVSDAGDVNNDGYDDVMAGHQGFAIGGNIVGSVRVFSGIDGSDLYTLEGIDAPGASVVGQQTCGGAGDVNGDGYDDMISSAPTANEGGTHRGRVRIWSGLDGSVIRTHVGTTDFQNMGIDVSDCGDVNGDGFDDYIIGAHQSLFAGQNSGSIFVHSGLDGSVLFTANGDSAFDQLGISVSGGLDVDGDGFSDFVVGMHGDDNNGSNSGTAKIFQSETLPVLAYRTESGFPHFMNLVWQPNGGVPTALDGSLLITNATSFGNGLLAASLGRVDTLFFGFFPVLIDDGPGQVIASGSFGYDMAGSIVIPGITRSNLALAGNFVYLQAFETAPLALTSNALQMLVE